MPRDEDSEDDVPSSPESGGSRPGSVTVYNRQGPVLFTGVLVCLGPKCFAHPPNDPKFNDKGLDATIAQLLQDKETKIIPYDQVRVQVVGDSVLVTLLDATGPAALSSNKLTQELLLLSLNPSSKLYAAEIGKPLNRDVVAARLNRDDVSDAFDSEGRIDDYDGDERRHSQEKAADRRMLNQCQQMVGDARHRLEECIQLTAELGDEIKSLQSQTAELTRGAPETTTAEPSGTRQIGDTMKVKERSAMASLEDALAMSRRSLHKPAVASPQQHLNGNDSALSEELPDSSPLSRQTWNPRGVRELGRSFNSSGAWDTPDNTPSKHRTLDDEYRDLLRSRLPFRQEWEMENAPDKTASPPPRRQEPHDTPVRLRTPGKGSEGGAQQGRGEEERDALRRVDERVSRILTSMQTDTLSPGAPRVASTPGRAL